MKTSHSVRWANLKMAVLWPSLLVAACVSPAVAKAEPYRVVAPPPPPPPPRVYHRPPPAHVTVYVDRGRPGWWRGQPDFIGYVGPRPGFYFAPGYGYYAAPPGYVGRTWIVGATLPVPYRGYVVVNPVVYGVPPAPVGYSWYYAGDSLVLAALATGVIIGTAAGGW